MALDTAKHKNVLIKILKDIYTDATISPILGFKGGTAATFFYGLDRFSVDLDFDLLDSDKEDYVFDRVKAIIENYGKLKEARKKRFNLFYILSYDDKDINAQNVKVEINRREFGSKYAVESFLGISMQVMIKEDMVAHKLCAMYERIGKTNRDIDDVLWFELEVPLQVPREWECLVRKPTIVFVVAETLLLPVEIVVGCIRHLRWSFTHEK